MLDIVMTLDCIVCFIIGRCMFVSVGKYSERIVPYIHVQLVH